MRAVTLSLCLLLTAGSDGAADAAAPSAAAAKRASAWSLAFLPARALPAAKAAGYDVSAYRAIGRGNERFQASGRSRIGATFKASGPSARRIGQLVFSIEVSGPATAEKRQFADSIRAFVRRLGITDGLGLGAIQDEQETDGFAGDESENVPVGTSIEKLGRGARRITYSILPPAPAPGN